MARKNGKAAKKARTKKSGSTPKKWTANPVSDGLIVQVGTADMSPKDAEKMAKAIAADLPGDWVVSAMGDDCRDYSFRRPLGKKNPSASQAWDLSYRLKQHRDIADAEPALYQPVNGQPDMLPSRQRRAAQRFQASAASSSGSGGGDDHLACSVSKTWSLDLCNIPQAWSLPRPGGGKSQGEGIIVGHPDTGFTRHSEINDAARLLASQGFDFEDDDRNPLDDLSGFSGGHGTSTASVIMSGTNGDVTGVAPKAQIVPLRVTDSVVLLSFSKLARAIRFAADNGFHVVSISLGGPFGSNFLTRAVQHAVDRGVIVLAAAGNFVPFRFVVFPAAIPEVVAVAACHCGKGAWEPSSSGSEIDITAPGTSVWRAQTTDSGFGNSRGNGTSYAVATTAGVAALWLAHHGRANLISRFGRSNVPSVFKELLLTKGFTKPRGWDTSEFGPGILDAKKLLSAPLPSTPPAARFTAFPEVPTLSAMNTFDRLMRQFPGGSPSRLRSGLRRMLNVSERQLECVMCEVGSEIEYHLATNPTFREQLLTTPAGETAKDKSKAMRSAMRTKLKQCASKRLLSALKG